MLVVVFFFLLLSRTHILPCSEVEVCASPAEGGKKKPCVLRNRGGKRERKYSVREERLTSLRPLHLERSRRGRPRGGQAEGRTASLAWALSFRGLGRVCARLGAMRLGFNVRGRWSKREREAVGFRDIGDGASVLGCRTTAPWYL